MAEDAVLFPAFVIENFPKMNSRENPAESAEIENTGIPGLRSWRSVYIVVLASLFVWVALLVGLTQAFP